MLKLVLSIATLLALSQAFTAGANVHPSPTGDEIVISGHDLVKTVNCNGKNVVIDANDSTLTFRGQCNEVKVNGSTNTITLEEVATIVLESADNTVRWKKAASGAKPKVVDRSTGNMVSQEK